jgi:glycine/D-amino acid oxidase-like deaminating enzyme
VRVTVVGGGVIGLLTAVECVRAGHDVTLVERGGLPHAGATSFDRHRIIRALHPADPAATAAAVGAHHRWIELERRLSARFYHRVGALTVLPRDRQPPAGALSMLREAGARARVLDTAELTTAYPHIAFGAVAASATAVLEADAGVLLADRVLAACVGWLRRQPRTTLHSHRAAAAVDGAAATVRLADGTVLAADAVVVAAGPWSAELLPADIAAELTLYRQSMIYCRVPERYAAAWSATPAIPSLGTADGSWLVPPVAGTPLKLSAASACRIVDRVAGGVGCGSTAALWRDHLTRVFGALIPGLRADWVTGGRDCHYLARTSTGGPMLVALGGAVIAYAACGGSSFKFAPLIARSLAQRVAGLTPEPTGLPALDQRPAHVLT